MTKEYRLMIALLRFKAAYTELTAASQELPDLDVSDFYPFYLLDFEKITPAVVQWCNVQATKLAQGLPDEVDNPACTTCEHFRDGIGTDGLCKAYPGCANYPVIMFTENQARAFLKSEGVDVSSINDVVTLHIAYVQKMEELYEKRKSGGSTV